MSHGPARIQSPDILRNFRGRLVVYDDVTRNALLGVDAMLKRTSEWLKGEQQLYWKKELRRHVNAVNLAQNEYNRTKMSSTGNASNAVLDAKKVLDKAKRQQEEAEKKLEATKKWATRFTAYTEKLVAAVRSFEILLDETTPKGLSRLDRMVENLEEYLRATPPEAT